MVLATVSVLGGCQATPCGCSDKASDEEGWIDLFNGHDLTDWTPKFVGHEAGVNYKNTFRAEDGVLKVAYDQYDEFGGAFGHLFYRQEFSNYLLRLEYRFVGQQVPGGPGWAYRNNGVMVHGQPVDTMGLDQSFPVSIEVQLLGGDGTSQRPTGNVCTPGTHIVIDHQLDTRHCINSSSATYHGDQWVCLEIEVRGNELIRHKIDGEMVMEYRRPQLDENDPDAMRWMHLRGGDAMLTGGTISLQAESAPCQFRNIELLPLDH